MVGTQQLSELFFASSNENKFQEAERILTNLGVKVNFSKTTLEEIQSSSLSEIAEQKAISAYELIQKPVIIEDDGLFINSLDGSTATYTIPMSYRLLCSNEIPHMMRSIYASGRKLMEQFRALATLTWHSRKVLQHKYATFEDYLAEATKSRFVHNVKPDPDLLMNSIALQLEQVKTILPIYKKLATTKLTKKRVEQIIGISTPESSAMPISLTRELRPNTAGVIAKRKDKEWNLVEVDETKTEYDLLNEYSWQLTHHPNVRSSVVSNLGHYEKLHRHFFSPHQQILTVPN